MIKNTVIVGEENDERLFRTTCTVSDINWLDDVSFPLECEAQIRYRQKPQRCRVEEQNGLILVTFDEPQRAITPGQVCAFYDGDRVLGSGII